MMNDDETTSRTMLDSEWESSQKQEDQPTSSSIEPTIESEPSELEEKIRKKMRQQPRIRKDPLIGRVFGERFELVSKIGAGGMGVVYKARQRAMDRHVAIKVLLKEYLTNETAVRRFQREALAVSKLEHPNTVRIYDFGETEDKILYIAMEFLPGMPLSRMLAKQRQLAVRQVLRVVTQICRSLDEAHRKGIVHRDLKPDNVFVGTIEGQRDFVKVLDFGVAKLREGGDDGATLTQHGVLFGTPKYMSPEQCRSQVVDARSDLYAVGVMMYEMLAGRVPFEADNSMAILVAHAQDAPAPLASVRPDLAVPFEVEELMHSLLAKEPEARPQSAKQVIQSCETLLHAVPDDFERVITYESEEAQALQIDRSQAYTMPEDALSRTQVNRLAESDNQVAATVAIDAPSLPRSRTRRALATLLVLGVLGLGAAFWAYQQLEPVHTAARQLIPEVLSSSELPPIPFELVSITASANVDNVTIVDPKTDEVLGTLPTRDVRKSFQWLKEPGRIVTVELRHGSLAPIRQTIDLGRDSVLPRAEFVTGTPASVGTKVETVQLRVISNLDGVLIALSDREAAYPLAAGISSKLITVTKGEKPVVVTVTRAGYLSAEATFVPTADGEIRVAMEEDPNAKIVSKRVAITLQVNTTSVDVVLPNGLKYVTPKKRGEALSIELEQASAPLSLALSKRGYESATIKVVPDESKTITASLVRRKRPANEARTNTTVDKPSPPKTKPLENPRLSPLKSPKTSGPGRLGRLKGF
jgi:serine/threonine protein kinase